MLQKGSMAKMLHWVWQFNWWSFLTGEGPRCAGGVVWESCLKRGPRPCPHPEKHSDRTAYRSKSCICVIHFNVAWTPLFHTEMPKWKADSSPEVRADISNLHHQKRHFVPRPWPQKSDWRHKTHLCLKIKVTQPRSLTWPIKSINRPKWAFI